MAEDLLITRMTSDDIDDVVLLDRSIFMILRARIVILRLAQKRYVPDSQTRR